MSYCNDGNWNLYDIDYKDELNYQINKYKKTWTTKYNEEIKIVDLTDKHLINIIKLYYSFEAQPHCLLLEEYYKRVNDGRIKDFLKKE